MEINRTTDALGRDSGFSLGSGYSVQYGYDAYGRFSSLRAFASLRETNTFTYSRLPDTDLISGMTASSGFLWTRAYETARSLITSVENRYGETVVSRYDYTNDELGRRTSRADSGLAFAAQPTYGDPATVEMPAYNAYSYNGRSEVTGAARRWGTPAASGDLVLGQQYAYAFDDIGNRITSAEGDTDRSATYTANALNQYTQRTVPDEKDLIGTAPTNVAVTVNQNAASRQSFYWHHALEVTNAASAVYPQVAITAVYTPPGTNNPDVVSSVTGRVFVAKTPEAFTYDSDGNLTKDGRFDYTWNGENRLIKAETRDDLPASVPRVKVEYAYDHQGRRIASGTSIWTNDTWQTSESRSFVYDGWNVVAEQVGRTVPGEPSIVATNLYTWGLDLSGSRQGAGGIGGLLAASLDGTTAFYSHDANGNVSQLVSPYGDLLAHYEYSPFGETVVSTGPLAKANPFHFSTKWFDNDTGLGYWGYRWYSPSMGRWLSRDPLNETGSQYLKYVADVSGKSRQQTSSGPAFEKGLLSGALSPEDWQLFLTRVRDLNPQITPFMPAFWSGLDGNPYNACLNALVSNVDPNGEFCWQLLGVGIIVVSGIAAAYFFWGKVQEVPDDPFCCEAKKPLLELVIEGPIHMLDPPFVPAVSLPLAPLTDEIINKYAPEPKKNQKCLCPGGEDIRPLRKLPPR